MIYTRYFGTLKEMRNTKVQKNLTFDHLHELLHHFKMNESSISQYFPLSLYKALFSDKVEADEYILCPLYKFKGSFDIQLGMTGTQFVGEPSFHTATRELQEELGIKPNELESLQKISSDVTLRKNVTSYVLKLKDCRTIEYPRPATNRKDSKNKKIGCIVCGKENEIRRYCNAKYIYRKHSSDPIVGVIALPVLMVQRLVKDFWGDRWTK
jgi:hypothetical protein